MAGGGGNGFLETVPKEPPESLVDLTGDTTSGRDDDDVFPPDILLEVLVVEEIDGRGRWFGAVAVGVVPLVDATVVAGAIEELRRSGTLGGGFLSGVPVVREEDMELAVGVRFRLVEGAGGFEAAVLAPDGTFGRIGAAVTPGLEGGFCNPETPVPVRPGAEVVVEEAANGRDADDSPVPRLATPLTVGFFGPCISLIASRFALAGEAKELGGR